MREEIIKKIEDKRIIAIIRGLDTETAVKTAKALYAGGIKLIEVTFDQKSPENFYKTADSIKGIKAALSDVSVGAGTVLTTEQVDMARDAGAEFIISPDADEQVIRYTVKRGMVSMPGAYTATEIKKAHVAGADFVKIFPCLDGAAKYIKAIKAPFSHVKLMAVGGVNADNCQDFINAGAVGVGVGGSLINKEWIKNGEFDKLTSLAEKFVKNMEI